MTVLSPPPIVADAHLQALQPILDGIVGPRAADIDRHGTFPREAVTALADAGLLGLTSAPEVGGQGRGLREAAEVVERLAQACGSTAMVVMMHYAAVALLEQHADVAVRRRIAAGEHLSTLAFSETGSRSHFWAPVGSAAIHDDGATVRLDARKSWVTSAGEADSYVWSSRPCAGEGMSLWLVPSDTPGLRVAGSFDGLGLRGNASRPVAGEGVLLPMTALLGPHRGGTDVAFSTALPCFLVLNAAFSVGLMTALVEEARQHLIRTRFEHLGQTLAEQPTARLAFARLQVRLDLARTCLQDTISAIEEHRDDEMLRVLEVKAVGAEAAAEVADGAMRLCGGAAFRKELGIERRLRDSLAARVMAPTTDALHDFIARLHCGMPLFDERGQS
ncbi:MAG TPA: acyl-CoA dehydrogenase family protein [Mycobacteriales bacterium]